jgi:cell division transport system permease protein
MSTTRSAASMVEPWDELDGSLPLALDVPVLTSIVPRHSIAGRSLAVIVAIMTFLAAFTLAAAMAVVGAASNWQSEVGREVTIQVRPAPGRDIEADLRRAAALTRASAGISDARIYTKQESASLIEPWIGNGLALDDLPIPRLIVVKLSPGARADLSGLRRTLAVQVPGSTLDDHRRWIDSMRQMAVAAAGAGAVIVALVLAATVLSVTFATRGAMATNRPIVEVLHYVGATDGFIARQFQRHFLALGLKGGAIGGAVAIGLFGLLQAANAWFGGQPEENGIAALFGNLSLGTSGYAAMLLLIMLMALVTALASRHTLNRTLQTID